EEDLALECFEQARKADPTLAAAHYNCGVIEYRKGDLAAAVASNRAAIALEHAPVLAWSNLGIALEASGDSKAAHAAHDDAIEKAPNDASAYWNKALLHLRCGEYQQGWPFYEWRWAAGKAGVPARHYPGRPLWLGGTPIAGRRILLTPEQGLGDIIQFARFAPLVTAQGGRVILEVFTPLQRLFANMAGVETVVGSGEPLPSFDAHCPLLSVPLALGITTETLPRDIPYVRPDPALVENWRKRLGPCSRPRIGFVWKGNSKFPGNAARSVPLAQFATLFAPDAEFICLQKEVTQAEEKLLAGYDNVRQIGASLEDFADTAAVLALCDFALVTDTGVAHLAGAMGKPGLILLSAHPDWRWCHEDPQTGWYPTLWPLRQHTPNQWDRALKTAHRALQELVTPTGTDTPSV
ncbi:MAG TPA: tetratricopeptide repeat protein, partial [Acidocella sp.]|nr:tetratricopeptide repeat protein [Acidocella sp.]HQU05372.1 tetratricopeptide repeat protein [Acidocella sp.]